MLYFMKAFDLQPGSIHAPIELINVKHLLYITLQPMRSNDINTRSATFEVRFINPKQIPTNPKEHGYKKDLFNSVEFDMADTATSSYIGTATMTNGKITYKFTNSYTNKVCIPKRYKAIKALLDTYYRTDYHKEPKEIARDKRYYNDTLTKADKQFYKKHYGITHGFEYRLNGNSDNSDDTDLPF